MNLELKLNESYYLTGYPNKFEQVILHLLKNAKDSIIEKRERLKLKERDLIEIELKKSDAKISISIEDSGVGVDNSIRDRIFEPYFSTKEQGKGSGVGLYMSKMIIENMQGELKNIPIDKGAKFLIEF